MKKLHKLIHFSLKSMKPEVRTTFKEKISACLKSFLFLLNPVKKFMRLLAVSKEPCDVKIFCNKIFSSACFNRGLLTQKIFFDKPCLLFII